MIHGVVPGKGIYNIMAPRGRLLKTKTPPPPPPPVKPYIIKTKIP